MRLLESQMWLVWHGVKVCDPGWLYMRDTGEDIVPVKTVPWEGRNQRTGPS